MAKNGGPILVVDDDASVREALAELIASLGYPTDTAAHGKEALERIERRRPRLILLDLKMPVMDGWQLLRALRSHKDTARIPVLVLTAFGFEWEAELISAQGYLSKPADPDTIRERVREVVGPPPRRRAVRERPSRPAKTRARRRS